MANRTIQFWGQGYAATGTEPITITANLNGNVVYTGTIPTLYTSDVSRVPSDQVIVFTVDVPMDYAGTFPMSISLDNPVGVDAYFEQIVANYTRIFNPVFTPSEIGVISDPSSTPAEIVAIYNAHAVPPLSPAEIAILENGTKEEKDAVLVAHNITTVVSSGADGFFPVSGNTDPRNNVVINGVPVTRGDTPPGTWGWEVEFPAEGSGLIDYDLTIQAGTINSGIS
jgi:hypothetical protein